MQPDQNQNPTPYPVDYLNQIAPQQKKPGLSNKMFLMIVGGGVLVVAIIGLFVITGGGSAGPKSKMQTLSARLTTLQTIAGDAQKNLKSNTLHNTNSNLSIFLANTNRDIVDPLSKNGVDIKKLDENIVTKEAGEELIKTLEDARLNAVFDRTYAREMSYQLDTVAVLIRDIYKSTDSKSLKEFLETTDTNLQPLIKQLGEFNAANS